MMRTIFGIAGLGLALASCATPGREASSDSFFHLCRVEQADARGSVSLKVEIWPDGTRQNPYSVWTAPSREQGAKMRIEWTGLGPPAPNDDMMVTVWFPRRWLARRHLRLELFRRAEDRGGGGGLLAAPSYFRGHRPVSITRRLSELRALAAGEPFLLAGVAEEDGNLLAQDRIEMAQLDLAAQAFAAAHPRLEAMVADYRNSCRRTEESIVIT